MGFLTLTLVLAVIATLAFELPMINIEKIIFRTKDASNENKQTSPENKETDTELATRE